MASGGWREESRNLVPVVMAQRRTMFDATLPERHQPADRHKQDVLDLFEMGGLACQLHPDRFVRRPSKVCPQSPWLYPARSGSTSQFQSAKDKTKEVNETLMPGVSKCLTRVTRFGRVARDRMSRAADRLSPGPIGMVPMKLTKTLRFEWVGPGVKRWRPGCIRGRRL